MKLRIKSRHRRFKNRDRLLIMTEILEHLTTEGGGKTIYQIQFRNDLSYDYARRHITYLVDAGLVDKFGVSYMINEKGRSMYEKLNQLESMLGGRR